ncbi:MAG: STAS domain-containing protein [Candidatus Eremiobacteraeota bacterium]|nr:STAS domain-containing protein [Candidatus Eremiobacteraeota bacterium]
MTEQGRFVLSIVDGVPVVDVSGDVDISNVAEFQKVIAAAAGHDNAGVVTSLRNINYLDSRMVHELFTLSKRFSQNRRAFAVVWPESRSARYILEAAGVPLIVDFYDTLDVAVTAVKRPAS